MRSRRTAKIIMGPVLAAAVLVLGCTLDITEPVVPPLESWDPALNTHPDGEAWQALLDQYVREGLPGVVLYVETPEGLWNGAAGRAGIESGEAMTPTHLHFAASVTKMYTAAAVMLLVEDGTVGLDDPVSMYLPRSIYGRVPNADRATIRQLLGHTSGIPDFGGDLAYDLDTLNEPDGDFPPDRLLSYLEGQEAFSAPGESYFYSNANYLLLALMIDELTPSGHSGMIAGRILDPLGLSSTYYHGVPGFPEPPGLVNSYHDLYGDGRLSNMSDMVRHFNSIFIGYTGIIASSADFAAFVKALAGGSLVEPALLDQMKAATRNPHYGLGLSIAETPWGTGYGHDGGDLGILSEVRYFPGQQATIVILINGGNDGITDRLFKRLRDKVRDMALSGL